MEEGSTNKNKKTVFVGGLASDLDQTALIEAFSTFGDIIDVQIPPAQQGTNKPGAPPVQEGRHRGFAFITFATQLDAQDAIDNMDNNELRGSTLRVNLAKPQRGGLENTPFGRAIWESEDWLKAHAKPVGPAGVGALNPGNQDREEAGDEGEAEAMEE